MRARASRNFAVSMVFIALLVLTACGTLPAEGEQPSNNNTGERSDDAAAEAQEAREDAATPPNPTEIETATESTTRLGFDLFAALTDADPDENVITSPYSAAVLLTMLLNGAEGETREAIGEVLHLEDPFDDSINAQHQALASYLIAADPAVELAIANSLWAAEDRPFEDDYMNTMREALDSEIQEIDLGSPEAVDAIDEWVSEQTRERIEEMAEDLGLPDPNSVLVLLNAVYFLGDWTDPFDPEMTERGTFTLSDDSEVEVPLMNKDGMFRYAQRNGFQVLRLNYGETERYGMEIFLADEDVGLEGLRETLDASLWNETLDGVQEMRVDVTLPSFELEYSTKDSLNDALKDLGMEIAYDADRSDFTPMSPVDPWLSGVVQKTFIRVDEEGTEAAAVTGADMDESESPQFRADRPFMFTISDSETETILFLGQVADPSG